MVKCGTIDENSFPILLVRIRGALSAILI
jgi:hypothetical protein